MLWVRAALIAGATAGGVAWVCIHDMHWAYPINIHSFIHSTNRYCMLV